MLNARRAVTALDAVIDETLHNDPSIRHRAISILSRLGSNTEVAGMMGCLLKTKDQAERDEIEKSIVTVCRRIPNAADQANPILHVYAESATTDKLALMPLMGRVGGARSLAFVRKELASENAARPSRPALSASVEWRSTGSWWECSGDREIFTGVSSRSAELSEFPESVHW